MTYKETIYLNGSGSQTKWTSGNDHFWTHWTLKSKILLGAVIFLAILLALSLIPGEDAKVVSTAGSELPTLIAGLHIDLDKDGDGNPTMPSANVVMFPYTIYVHINDTSMDAIFGTLSDETNQDICVFHKNANGNWESWMHGEPWNPYNEIQPYDKYYVCVEKDCTLSLTFWD